MCEIETILSLFHHVMQEGCKLSLTGCVPARFRKDERSSRVFRENSCRELENYDGREAPQQWVITPEFRCDISCEITR